MPRIIIPCLMLLAVGSCGLYDPGGAQRLFFHDDPSAPGAPTAPVDHSKAAAAQNLERALIEPDQATAAALIRQAIGYLR